MTWDVRGPIAGRYEPERVIDSGGLATVLVCRDLNLDRRVAIKVLNRLDSHDRLLDEIRALQSIRSKHVVEVLDLVELEGSPARKGLVQEYIDGTTLDQLPNALSQRELLLILYQVAAGISEIHAHGIVHRDIKPTNMMIDASRVVKIIDFNLSRTQEGLRTVGFKGTPGFAAPELFAEEPAFDNSVDVYALAVSALYLLKRDLPAELSSLPPQPELWVQREGFRRCAAELEDLAVALDQALSRDPHRRPKASTICEVASRMILRGRHRALISGDIPARELSSSDPFVEIQSERGDRFCLHYTGTRLEVKEVSEQVRVNNLVVSVGARLPVSCVVALGPLSARGRVFITVDQSHPEVVL